MVSNDEFLSMIFGQDKDIAHVTCFPDDPSTLGDRQRIVWFGRRYGGTPLDPNTNQYFTISTFDTDEKGTPRRRKNLYRQTHCVVLDDVKEKLSEEAAQRLPTPSWILETSPGSEQWGYILTEPCTDPAKIDNLNDGLIQSELAPDSKDPGQKGVTRYVRLPEGVNSKVSKMINGVPFKCQMKVWNPFNRVTLEQLAAPFAIDINKARQDGRIDGATSMPDHPILQSGLNIKEVLSDGRFDITCPWVDEHTGSDDSGTAIFTNQDYSIGFKCHHGSCERRTATDVLRFLDQQQSGFAALLKTWQMQKEFEQLPPVSFLDAPPTPENTLTDFCDQISRINPASSEAKNMAAAVLKQVDTMPAMDKKDWHDKVMDLMKWSKVEFRAILKDLQNDWYKEKKQGTFFDDVVYITSLNAFYEWRTQFILPPDNFQNAYGHLDPDVRKNALVNGMVQKLDQLDYAPKQPKIYKRGNRSYANSWDESTMDYGIPGDVDPWYDHLEILGWGKYSKHIAQWMAFTLRHPDIKINHMLIFGSREGSGKDFVLKPLIQAMGVNTKVISGEDLINQFNGYLQSCKHVHINEAELGDRKEAVSVSNKIKLLTTSPPDTVYVNQKHIRPIEVQNIHNITMGTNSTKPLQLNGRSRRTMCFWSDFNPVDKHGNPDPAWHEYWDTRWKWLEGDGWRHVAYHLMHEVDLSDFNPRAAPPMTDFLEEIINASKSALEQTIEGFIERRIAHFNADLMTSGDMAEVLRRGEMFELAPMYCDGRYITPTKVGLTLKSMPTVKQVKTMNHRVWIVRDIEKYEAMTGWEIEKAYEAGMRQARETTLKLVK